MNHSHWEFAKGKISRFYTKNAYGIWQLPNSVQSDKVHFVDGTVLLNHGQPLSQCGKAMNWRKIDDLNPFSLNDLISEHAIATITVDAINVRKGSPTGTIIGTYKKGAKVEYTHKYVGNGHRYISWKEDGNYVFMAISGSEKYGEDLWATFSELPAKPNPKPTPKPEPKPSVDVKPVPEIKPNLTEKVKLYGIDVSEHNADIDLTNQDFVIIRATYGTSEDKSFKRNVEKCQKAKIPFGLYCYSYAINEQQMYDETKFFLDTIQGIEVPMGCWFDMEDADNWKVKHSCLTKEHCTRAAEVFCDMVSKAGYYVGVYSTPYWFTNYVITDRPKWYAHWGTNDGKVQYDYSKECVLYQYAANPIDKDLSYVDVSAFKSNRKDSDTKPIKPNDSLQSDEEKLNVKGVNKLVGSLLEIVEKF